VPRDISDVAPLSSITVNVEFSNLALVISPSVIENSVPVNVNALPAEYVPAPEN